MLNAAFIFIAPEADPEKHRSTIKTPEIVLTTIGFPLLSRGLPQPKKW